MRDFQNRIDSGNPSRSKGPGSNSRKKSASPASNERSPLGTTLSGPVRFAESSSPAAGNSLGVRCGPESSPTRSALATPAGVRSVLELSLVSWFWISQRTSSAKSLAIANRSDGCRERAFKQTRSSSRVIVASKVRGVRTSPVCTCLISSWVVLPLKGLRPASSSYNTTPRL